MKNVGIALALSYTFGDSLNSFTFLLKLSYLAVPAIAGGDGRVILAGDPVFMSSLSEFHYPSII